MRWAKVFNLKQMAQTVNFLTEHQLLDYAELAEKAAAATAHHNELSAQIKAAEKRMAETYRDQTAWNRMSLHNIARSGVFAADRAVAEYADNIWHVPHK